MLSFGPAGLASAEWGGAGKINLLLRLGPDLELRGVDEVLADLDVALTDKAPGVVDRPGLTTFLVDPGLESAFHELVEGKTQNVIELALALAKESVTGHSAEEGGTLEESPGVLLLQGEQLSGCLSDFGEGQLHSPDLSLVSEAELSDEAEFIIEPFLLVWSSRSLRSLRV